MTDLRGPGSRALVVGAGTFGETSRLPSVPAVTATARAIAEALHQRCGMPREHVSLLLDPASPRVFLKRFNELARESHDVLLLHYVGHGVRTHDHELYLATAATDDLRDGASAEAVPFREITTAIETSRATAVVVLDCCFSGQAPMNWGRGALLASSGRYERSLARPGEPYTVFGGAFLDALTEGVPTAPPRLTLRNVYTHIRATAESQGGAAPMPRLLEGGQGADLVLSPTNPAYTPAGPADGTARSPRNDDESPYRGLDPYLSEDSSLFFGREQLVERIGLRLAEIGPAGATLIVSGPSGAGKTSLLNAGVVPVMSRGGLGQAETGRWRYDVVTPNAGADHLREIARPTPGRTHVVVVDQFEEALATDIPGYLEAVTGIVHRNDSVTLVLVVRSDFLGHCANHPALVPALENEHVVVGPMDEPQLRSAIESPAERGGWPVEPGLTEILLRDMGFDHTGRAGNHDPGSLPLMSYALLRTWQARSPDGRLTVAGYRQAGGVASALADTAEKIYGDLDDNDKAVCVNLFMQMIVVGDATRETRRPLPLNGSATVLEPFAQARLVTLDDGQARLTHDALIHGWPRLNDWLTAHRGARAVFQEAEREARAWELDRRDPALLYRGSRLGALQSAVENAGPLTLAPPADEFFQASQRHRRRQRLRRRLVTGALVVLLVLTAGLAGLAVRRGNDLNDRLARTQAELLAGKALTALTGNPSEGVEMAVRAYAANPDSPLTRQALAQAYSTMGTRDADLDVGGVIEGAIFDAGADTALLRRDDGAVVVAEGLTGDHPAWWAMKTPGKGTGFSISADGKAAEFDRGGKTLIWDLKARKVIRQWTRPGVAADAESPSLAVISADGERVVMNDADRITVYRADTGRRESSFTLPKNLAEANDLEMVMPGGKESVLVWANSRATLVSTRDGSVVRRFPSSAQPVEHGRKIFICSWQPTAGGQAGLLDTGTGATDPQLRPADNVCPGRPADVSLDKFHVVKAKSLDAAGTLREHTITSLRDGSTLRVVLPDPAGGSIDDGGRNVLPVAVGTGTDSEPRVFASLGRHLVRFRGERVPALTHDLTIDATDLSIAGDGEWLVADSSLKGISVVERRTGREIAWYPQSEYTGLNTPTVTNWSLVMNSRDEKTYEMNIDIVTLPDLDRKTLHLPGTFVDSQQEATFTGSGSLMVVMRSGTAHVIDVKERRFVTTLPVGDPAKDPRWSTDNALPMAMDPSARLLAVEDPDHAVQIWDVAQRKRLRTIHTGATGDDRSMAFDSTGDHVAVKTSPVQVGVWDVGSGERVSRVSVNRGDVAYSFTPDGNLITFRSTDGSLRLWDQATGQLEAMLTLDDFERIAVSPTQGFALVSSFGGIPYTMRLTPQGWADALCGAADLGRSMREACDSI